MNEKEKYLLEIESYCEDHGIDFESLLKIINEPKVVPMIRGIGFEYVVEKDLKKKFNKSKRFEIKKPIINAQLGTPDVDIEIFDNTKEKSIKLECKLSKNGSFSAESRLTKNPHCKIKVMRSRTLGEKNIQIVAKNEGIGEDVLKQHRDSYIFTHFDFVITNIRNAFYKTIDGKFQYSPSEEEESFLKSFFKTKCSQKINKLLINNHYFIESKFLIAKGNNIKCTKRDCTNKDDCIFIPNYPIFDLNQSTKWKPLSDLENYLNINF